MPRAVQSIFPDQPEAGRTGAPWQWRRTLPPAICSLGGMTFGYDLGALSGATYGLTHAYALSPAHFGFTVSASLWGAVCASPLAGRLADKLGRRGLLAVCASCYAAASASLALPILWSWAFVVALRVICGAAIAGFVVVCPLYLAEIAPRRLRGRFVGWFQMQIGAGVVVAFAVSALLAHRFSEAAVWRWCFGFGILPPLCLLTLLHWVPEEPHWLAARGRLHDAEVSAQRLKLSSEEWPIEGGAVLVSAPSLSERLFSRKYLRPLLLATSVALFNQLCGVTVLRVYLLDLLSSAGVGHFLSHTYGLIIACFNLLALLIGMMFVDNLGRRPLLIVGSAGMSLCLFALIVAFRQHAAAIFFPVILIAYNTFFASSQGAAAWVYLSEIFPFSVRAKGQGYGAFIHWIANAGLIWLYPVLEHVAAQSNFLLFACMMILQIAIVFFWYPETKGTRLGAISQGAQMPFTEN